MSNVRVVIPSLVADASHLAAMCDAATQAGASPVVIANGAHSVPATRRICESRIVTSQHNDGFAASVVLGAAGDWDWLVILNDDLIFDPADLASCLSAERLDAFGRATLVHFDDGSARRIPTRLSVLLNVSLLSNIARKARRKTACASNGGRQRNSYRSFSAVAIGRQGMGPRWRSRLEISVYLRRCGLRTQSEGPWRAG